MRAYTLIEVIVTLLLATIIIGVAISGYLMINNQFKLFDKMTTESIDILRFHNFIKNDFIKSPFINIENNQLNCSVNELKINYVFKNNSIVRSSISTFTKVDSLNLKSLQINTFFQGELINFGIVDSLVLKCRLYGNEQVFFYSKEYSATELMNYD